MRTGNVVGGTSVLPAIGLAIAGLFVLLMVLRPDLGRNPPAPMETRDGSIQKASAREALGPQPDRRAAHVVADDVEQPPSGISG